MKEIYTLFFSIIVLSCTLSAQPTHTFTGGIDTAWVRFYSSGLEKSDDEAIAMAMDDSGNIYVTGITSRYDKYRFGQGWLENGEITTLKYTPAGDVAWMRTYDSPDRGPDIPSSIAIDAGGNVYVSGLSGWGWGGVGGKYFIIKYSPSGGTSWVRHCPGLEIAVDAVGNVYVAGTSTIKYSPSGDTLWIRGGGFAISIDASGSVYVLGDSLTKYSSSGNTLWVGNFNVGSAKALDVDANGNVYVTGNSIIKYSPSGDTLWVRQYDVGGANALEIDPNGDVYVLGSSLTKYSSSGDVLWARNMSGGGARALDIDVNGNVFLTGSISTTKYSPSGDTLWVNKYSDGGATAISVDPKGDVGVIGWCSYGTNDDYTTIKYSSSGETLWIRRHEGLGGGQNYLTAHVVDAGGNVYVTGTIWSGTSSDYATVKYSSSGEFCWARLYNGLEGGDDYANAIALDASGNVLVTGIVTSTVGGLNHDYATIKYTPSGDTLWVRYYTGPGNGNDEANALAVDATGNVYVTGTSTIKYSSSGELLWVRELNGGSANALVIDANGLVYVTGTSTTKYSPSGDVLWVNGRGGGSALGVDANGYVYVIGCTSFDTLSDYRTIKYSPAGDTLWVRNYDGPGHGLDFVFDLAVDGGGNVFVTGSSWSGTVYEFATIKYSPDGDTLWIRRHNNPQSNDFATNIAIDFNGNVYVRGISTSGILRDIATVKYSSDGGVEWTAKTTGVAYDQSTFHINWDDPPIRRMPITSVDNAGNVYVTGAYRLGEWSFLYMVIKYAQTTTSVHEGSKKIPSSYTLEQNYPNPFNPTTTIRFALPHSTKVTLVVYDLLGREIETLVDEEQTAGWKQVQWNASAFSSGMYLARMTAGSFVTTKKILLMK